MALATGRSPSTSLRRGLGARFVLAAVVATPSAGAAGDPHLQYWTIETPHFRVHYAKGLEPVAERVADLAESVHGRLTPALGHTPKEVTELVITDNTESANGSATALPYNAVRLYATAPDDMSPLSDYDDWFLALVTHEYTHILHTDNISGAPALVNAVLGKSMAPNQVQPRWILEGLAVLEESRRTSGGRNRSSLFDMYLRADVLSGRVARLDQVSHLPRRWPSGNLWYLYGSRFLTWISEVYGEHVMRAVSADYGHLLLPWGLNRSVRRATGNTYDKQHDGPALYDGWRAHLSRKYAAQLERAFAEGGGQREGRRLTHHGRDTLHPRYLPKRLRRQPDVPEVVYYSSDAHGRPGFYRLPLPTPTTSWESQRDLFLRVQGSGSVSFDVHGDAVFNTVETHKRVWPFSDLSLVRAGGQSPDGDEPERVRLTEGLRALDPDVSLDGRTVVFSKNRRGTTSLWMGDVTAEGTLPNPRPLVPSRHLDQVYTPRLSPDGRRVAYSVWQAGGARDLRIVDVKTGEISQLTHDRALDQQPSWSPDGKTLFFVSDRTGIQNVYAMDVASRETWQVTNVRTGAFMPEVSPDGASLVYVGYTSDGFDLFGMPIDRATWTEARPYVDDRPDPHPMPEATRWPRHLYDPLPSLRPRAFTFEYGPGAVGDALTISTQAFDAVGFHGLGASATVDSRGEPQVYIGYSYGRLPIDLGVSVFRAVGPRQGFRVNGKDESFDEDYLALSTSLSYTVPRPFDSFVWSLAYTASRYRGRLQTGPRLDPFEPVLREPVGLGVYSIVRGSFSYSNLERYLYSVGPSRGTYFTAYFDYAGKETASELPYWSFGHSVGRHTTMPWHPDHTLVTRLEGGIVGGDGPRRGAYYTGGFVNLPLPEAVRSPLFSGSFLLRGYPPNAYSGRQYHLATTELRLPIWHPERGYSTLPAFFNRLSGAVFADYGGAFETLDVEHWRSQLHTSFGAELLLDATFGYFMGLTARIGYAYGLSEQAYSGGQKYLVISTPY